VELIANRPDDLDGGVQLGIVEPCHHLIEYEKLGSSGDGSCQF
jgi:hypothetical protein